jgi:hypothetical protein
VNSLHIEELLEKSVSEIEISDSMNKTAHKRHLSVGEWLCRDGSKLKNLEPSIYPQGSFNLGTAVQPISPEDDYDVDSVCELNQSKTIWSQKQLKDAIGDELQLYTEAQNMNNPPEEGKRCWTLIYSDSGHGFHFDILPSVPKNLDNSTNISITDTKHDGYNVVCNNWEQSNPKGYLAWFKSQMEIRLVEARKDFATRFEANVDTIPVYRVKTPLQKTIILLKRHRDIYFLDKDYKPISIIITTLAAHAYNNEASLEDALKSIAHNVHRFIYKNRELVNRYQIKNPSNSQENFAEKWNTEPKLAESFYIWLKALKDDIEILFNSKQRNEQSLGLLPFIGERNVNSVFGQNMNQSREVSSDFFNLSWRKRRTEIESDSVKNISITARFKVNGFRDKDFYSGSPLSVKSNLTFIANEKFQNAKYYWQVLNTGEEAERNAQTRGGFYEGSRKGGRVRTESTKYMGTHMVQCFAINNGVIIGKSKEFVVNVR